MAARSVTELWPLSERTGRLAECGAPRAPGLWRLRHRHLAGSLGAKGRPPVGPGFTSWRGLFALQPSLTAENSAEESALTRYLNAGSIQPESAGRMFSAVSCVQGAADSGLFPTASTSADPPYGT